MITENPRTREKSGLSEAPDKVEVEMGQLKLRQILLLNAAQGTGSFLGGTKLA